MQKKNSLSSLTMITLLMILAMIVIWSISMYCITSITAEYAATRYLENYEDFASTIANRNFEHWLGEDFPYINYDENRLWEAVDEGGSAESYYNGSGESNWFIKYPKSNNVYSATAIYDAEGNLLECSWNDFFYFEYMTEEQWKNREERTGNKARANFNREMLTEIGQEILNNNTMINDARAMRFIGTFDGIEFTPQKIEYINHNEFQEALSSKGSGQYTVSGVVEDYDLPWIMLYDDSNTVFSDDEIVTFYSDWFDVCFYQSSPSFMYNGLEYESVKDLVDKLGPKLSSGQQTLPHYEGLNLLIPSVNYCFSINGETYYSSYYHDTEDIPQVHFYTVSLVYCSPWRTAFNELHNVYLYTLFLAVVLVVLIRSVIQRNLIRPVQFVGETMMKDSEQTVWITYVNQAWREAKVLQDGFAKYSDDLRMLKNEITRLNTALEYAKTAEDNRRLMTSNIAHELKTPLAVIHSYAEGLKERIAEEKREKYIDVILEEAERTDGMVLEMLDLSRLEAGKVKLSRDEFSLIELTKSIFDKLEMVLQEKNLHINYDFPEDCRVIADENRIGQVVENFVTNAIKYTPFDGQIRVKIQKHSNKTLFLIENDSEPLSDEALSKVWDTFYRTDESRSSGGTGLGLAIAKTIIELHGGKCSVRNTNSGVEFSFSI